MRADRPILLSFHPTSHGFGWAAFTDPHALHSFAVYTAKGDKNAGCLRKVGWLLKRFAPAVFVIEAFDTQSSLRSERVRELCLSVIGLAADHGAELAVYTREETAKAFASTGAITRQEIAAVVASQIPHLAERLPPPRKPWMSEDKRMSLFAAAALALTHYHNEATALLDELRNAA